MSNFKKSDLRTGMKVTLRNGKEYIVLLNCKHRFSNDENIIVRYGRSSSFSGSEWLMLTSSDEDLHMKNRELLQHDVVLVEECEHLGYLFSDTKPKYNKMVKEMTLEEIEREFGCKIKLKPNN